MSIPFQPFVDPDVKAIFDAYPDGLRGDLLQLRKLIFDTAGGQEDVGDLIETTKWGQPAYLPSKPRTGSTVRIDILKNQPGRYALFVHCRTTLVETFRELYPEQFVFDGNRAVLFTHGNPVDRDALEHCIALALTYHTRHRRDRTRRTKR